MEEHGIREYIASVSFEGVFTAKFIEVSRIVFDFLPISALSDREKGQ